MFERYTQQARRAIFFARFETSQFGGTQIETEHLLLGILREHKPLADRVFAVPGSEDALRQEITERSARRERSPTSVDLPLSEECKRVLTSAAQEAEGLSHKHIGCEHLVLGLMREEHCFAAGVIRRAGVTVEQIHDQAVAPTAVRRYMRPAGPSPGRGALWGAGYLRKSQTLKAMFHWQRRLSVPREALVRQADHRLMLYAGQEFDAAEFDLVKDGWTHDHCVICWKMIYLPEAPSQSFGYSNGQEWLCQRCYEGFVSAKER
jgi:Clp amino terminal domain, pathogenicity island component